MVKWVKVDIEKVECYRCGHRWIPKKNRLGVKITKLPSRCPKCNSPYWDRPRTRISLKKSSGRKEKMKN